VRACCHPTARADPGGRRRARAARRGDVTRAVARTLFARLADREEPPELLLVAAIPTASWRRPATRDGVVVLVDRPSSPGNLGTIIRTADALGAAGVLITGHGAHLYDPAPIRASVGSLFVRAGVPSQHDALVDVARRLARRRPDLRVYATDEDGDLVLDGHARSAARPCCCSAASERASPASARPRRRTVAIPMAARPARSTSPSPTASSSTRCCQYGDAHA
jgi:TrmH family RNA methyltransferase